MNNPKSCSERTKQKIALALKELMKTTSFDKITVSDITDACGIHRQTFYYHFVDRYELLDWLLYNELLLPFIDGFRVDNLYDKFLFLFTTMRKDKHFYQHALKINGEEFTRYISKVATEDFTKLINSIGDDYGILNNDPSAVVLIAEFFGYGISGIIHSWALKEMKESPNIMADRVQFLIDSIETIVKNKAQV